METSQLLRQKSQSSDGRHNMKGLFEMKRSTSALSGTSEVDEANVGLERPEKTIGNLGSLCLIANNIAGPGMMSLPHVFFNAGILPSTLCCLWVFVGSSLCGTVLSEAISSLPGNSDFDSNIEFSLAFLVLGDELWYILAEMLFLASCMVQCFSGIVEVAHTIDAVLASSILGKTYALQLYPSLEFIHWSDKSCDSSSTCTPFYYDGPFIVSLGYILTTAILYPFGTGHLKETISFQIFAFFFMIVVVGLFFKEFIVSGLPYSVPWVGADVGQLVGVILFNYAFSITVPAWLNEKKSHVSVNNTIWGSSAALTLMYILFGLLGAMAYSYPPADMLSILGSTASDSVTRLCATMFGIVTIGCGVPIYCVLIKNTLYAGRTCDAYMSFFWGAIFPYSVSFLMYQGSFMLAVLSWTGLVVNGAVAFVLPLLLGLFLYRARRRSFEKIKEMEQKRRGSTKHIVKKTNSGRTLSIILDKNATPSPVEIEAPPVRVSGGTRDESTTTSFMSFFKCFPGVATINRTQENTESYATNTASNGYTSVERVTDDTEDEEDLILDGSVHPLYSCLVPYQYEVVTICMAIFAVMIISTVYRNTIRSFEGLTDDYSPSDDGSKGN